MPREMKRQQRQFKPATIVLVPTGFMLLVPAFYLVIDLLYDGKMTDAKLIIEWTLGSVLIGVTLAIKEYRLYRKGNNKSQDEQ